jgi:hypothetical protein
MRSQMVFLLQPLSLFYFNVENKEKRAALGYYDLAT